MVLRNIRGRGRTGVRALIRLPQPLVAGIEQTTTCSVQFVARGSRDSNLSAGLITAFFNQMSPEEWRVSTFTIVQGELIVVKTTCPLGARGCSCRSNPSNTFTCNSGLTCQQLPIALGRAGACLDAFAFGAQRALLVGSELAENRAEVPCNILFNCLDCAGSFRAPGERTCRWCSTIETCINSDASCEGGLFALHESECNAPLGAIATPEASPPPLTGTDRATQSNLSTASGRATSGADRTLSSDSQPIFIEPQSQMAKSDPSQLVMIVGGAAAAVVLVAACVVCACCVVRKRRQNRDVGISEGASIAMHSASQSDAYAHGDVESFVPDRSASSAYEHGDMPHTFVKHEARYLDYDVSVPQLGRGGGRALLDELSRS